jgi:hypothetical protein
MRGSTHSGRQLQVSRIAVHAAYRTQSPAIGPAERFHRNRQVKLVAHDLAEIDRVVLVERNAGISLAHFRLVVVLVSTGGGCVCLIRLREEQHVQVRVHRNRQRIQAPPAVGLQHRLEPAHKADLLVVLGQPGGQLYRSHDPEVLARELERPGGKLPDHLVGAAPKPP